VIDAIASDPMPAIIVALLIYLLGLKRGRKEQRREWGMPRG
jgi:hypothetical protein